MLIRQALSLIRKVLSVASVIFRKSGKTERRRKRPMLPHGSRSRAHSRRQLEAAHTRMRHITQRHTGRCPAHAHRATLLATKLLPSARARPPRQSRRRQPRGGLPQQLAAQRVPRGYARAREPGDGDVAARHARDLDAGEFEPVDRAGLTQIFMYEWRNVAAVAQRTTRGCTFAAGSSVAPPLQSAYNEQ